MKFNQSLRNQIGKYQDYVIIVEGNKDVNALKALGFQNVHAIHSTGVSLKERAEQIASQLTKKDKVCILTDLDKRGRQLYHLLKTIFQELGARLDSTFRGILIKSKVSHIEGLDKFIDKIEAIE